MYSYIVVCKGEKTYRNGGASRSVKSVNDRLTSSDTLGLIPKLVFSVDDGFGRRGNHKTPLCHVGVGARVSSERQRGTFKSLRSHCRMIVP